MTIPVHHLSSFQRVWLVYLFVISISGLQMQVLPKELPGFNLHRTEREYLKLHNKLLNPINNLLTG